MDKHKVQECAIWAGSLLLLGIAIAIAWHVVPTVRSDWSVFDRIFSIVTAIGTVAAVGVSLWLATSERRTRQADELVRAQLAAARLVADLERPVEELRRLVDTSSVDDMPSSEAKRQAAIVFDLMAMDMIKDCLSRKQWQIESTLLIALVPLGNNVAHRLEYGTRKLVALKALVQEYKPHWGTVPVSEQQSLIKGWIRSCDIALGYISVAFYECQDAAQIGAPEPTPVEIFGIPLDAK